MPVVKYNEGIIDGMFAVETFFINFNPIGLFTRLMTPTGILDEKSEIKMSP